MIAQTIPSRHTGAAVRAAGLIAVCLTVPIAAAWSAQPPVRVPANAAKVSLADLDLTASEGIVAHGSAWPTATEDAALSEPRESAPDTSVVAVSIADLDLMSPQGVIIARERIHNTARRLCGQLNSSHGPASYYSQCVNDATTGALRQINESAP